MSYAGIIASSRLRGDTTSFITTWETTTPDESITIPTTGGGYNYRVDWGDGTVTTGHTGDATHIYATAGTYTVKISGDFPRIYFNNTGDRLKIKSIEQWGNIQWSSMNNVFYGCSNLVGNATDIPNISLVTNMSFMFCDATSFNQDIGSWNVNNVTNMSRMFYNATSFNQDIGSWNVGNVTNMYVMFNNATSFNQDLSSWNVGSVTNMYGMFYNATSFNQDLSSWNVGNVTNMSFMFFNATSFNQDIGSWNVNNVTNMSFMFRSAISFNQNLGGWSLTNIIDMSNMFTGVTLSTANYDAILIGWNNNLNTPNSIQFNGGNSKYDTSAAARTNLINVKGWTIQDGGPV